MSTLHLIVGLPCSGKTTLARELEHCLPGMRLTPDEWHMTLFGDDLNHPDHNQRHASIEAMLWRQAERLLQLGMDVILDFGFWTRSERDDFRQRARRAGVKVRVHFLDLPLETLLARLAQRNAARNGHCFRIDEAQLRQWSDLFQPPDAAELEIA